MALNANQLQAMFARRREMDHVRTERSAALSRYYDHWGKVTSRFENWTKPEYYEQADAQMRAKQEKKEKATKLIERQEKLRKLFNEEKVKYDSELQMLKHPRAKHHHTVDMETLEKIAKQNREREDIKRKLELEAKLYGRWRHGVDDDKLIFDSKSDHEVLAKLNWLDKKVDEEMDREKSESEAQERNLRLQEEKRKIEQAQVEREQLRIKEIESLTNLQEQHMAALKSHHEESKLLRDEEKLLRNYTRELQQERELLDETSVYVRETPEIAQAFNLRKLKVLTRQRAETFRNQIRLIINILERMQPYAIQREKLDSLLQDYREDLESEELAVKYIDSMYESEAKHNLQRCEEAWQSQHLKHYNDLKRLIDDERFMQNSRLEENLKRQKEIIELRETYVEGIENSNLQLKKLKDEQDGGVEVNSSDDLNKSAINAKKAGAGDVIESMDYVNRNIGDCNSLSEKADLFFDRAKATSPDTFSDNGSLYKTTSSFKNLNLDVWQDRTSDPKENNSSRLTPSQRSLQVVTPGNAERPKFARKRVAWT